MILKQKTNTKYRNDKVIFNGEQFDSKREARRYQQLLMFQGANIITNLQRQVAFELVPAQYINGKCVERAVKYIADFVYYENGKKVVEDAKGAKTDVYKLKKKLMLYVHGIRIKES